MGWSNHPLFRTAHKKKSAMSLPDIPVIDAHHHFWDLDKNYLPWLRDEPPIPFRYGDYNAIRKNYMPEDFRRDTAGLNLVGSVFMETEWDRNDSVGEIRWVQEVAKQSGLPSAVVCHVTLHRSDAADVLAQQAQFPLVRGLRHKPAAAPSPDKIEKGLPGSMDDPTWRRGYALLEKYNMSFDLQTPWWHLEEGARLAADFPRTPIILNHTGLPRNRSEEELTGWRAAMEHFAKAPNVTVKISGLGEPNVAWSIERNRQVILDTIGIFGEDRCMFASNLPVDGLTGSYATIFSGFNEATRTMGPAVQKKLFANNARRIYRLSESTAP